MTATPHPTTSISDMRIPDPNAAGVSVEQTIGATIELAARNEELARQYFELCIVAFGFEGDAAADYARRCGIDYQPGWSDVDDSEL